MNYMQPIRLLRSVYKQAPVGTPGNMISQALQDFVYPNGQPLLVLKAVLILNEVQNLVELGQATQEQYDNLMVTMTVMTGYNKTELLERVAL